MRWAQKPKKVLISWCFSRMRGTNMGKQEKKTQKRTCLTSNLSQVLSWLSFQTSVTRTILGISWLHIPSSGGHPKSVHPWAHWLHRRGGSSFPGQCNHLAFGKIRVENAGRPQKGLFARKGSAEEWTGGLWARPREFFFTSCFIIIKIWGIRYAEDCHSASCVFLSFPRFLYLIPSVSPDRWQPTAVSAANRGGCWSEMGHSSLTSAHQDQPYSWAQNRD